MISRREALGSILAAGGVAFLSGRRAHAQPALAAGDPPSDPRNPKGSYTPVVTPNGTTLPWKMKGGVKEYHLIAEPVDREFEIQKSTSFATSGFHTPTYDMRLAVSSR